MDSDLEDAYDLREVSSDVEMHPDDLLSDARCGFGFPPTNDLLLSLYPSTNSRFEDVDEQPSKSLKRARDADDSESPKASKSDKKKKLNEGSGKPVSAPEVEQDKKDKKKQEKSKEKKEEKEVEKKEPATSKKPVEREVAGGVKVLDTKIGNGPMAKKGNKVLMRYIGRLSDGKVFDKNVKGNPVCDCSPLVIMNPDRCFQFTFHLGKGMVIKGAHSFLFHEQSLTPPNRLG